MTALCGGGTSGPKVGAAAKVDYSAGFLGVLLTKYDLPWLLPIIPLVGLAPLVLSTFCASDPPATPTFTQAEVDALLQLNFGPNFDSGLSKFKDWCLHMIWYDSCDCTSGALTPIAPPTQPAGSTTTVYPPVPIGAPCQTIDYPHGIDNGANVDCADACTWTFYDAGNRNLGQVSYVAHTGQLLEPFVPVPVGAKAVNLNITAGNCGNFLLGNLNFTVPNVTGAVLSHNVFWDAAAGVTHRYYGVRLYCNGQQPGAPTPPCCPPDAATAATLNTILDLVLSMQRNYAPFGYVLGLEHPGLTGTSSFQVSRVLGIKIEVTAHPLPDTQLPGNPPYVRDLGWISVSEADGMIQERRLSQLGFTWFPQLAPIATQVNYFLNPGVTVKITELKPEP